MFIVHDFKRDLLAYVHSCGYTDAKGCVQSPLHRKMTLELVLIQSIQNIMLTLQHQSPPSPSPIEVHGKDLANYTESFPSLDMGNELSPGNIIQNLAAIHSWAESDSSHGWAE